MEHHVRIHALGAAVVVALGLLVSLFTSTCVASRAYTNRMRQQNAAQQEITVKGSARMRVRSDLSVWSIAVSGEGRELAEAYAALENGVERVQLFLREQGFPSGEITLGPIDTDTHYHRDKEGNLTREVVGYTLTRQFFVISPDVDRVDGAAGEVTALLKSNIRVASAAPQFTFSKAADLKIEILGEASKDARARAEQIARNSGCRIGEVRNATMGVIQITQPHSTEIASYGLYDTSTIDKDVSVVVTATFGIEPIAG